ncbi:MAG: plasmid recombination protein [Bacilli bacterium]|nr:plasmid recombination protein [Bacilli bacterium]
MYDGKQVIRFENKFKAKDLGGLGIELVKRKGTGNYDKDRTKFNTSYVPLSKTTLQEQVYSKLKENEIYYNDSKNVNLLNGAIVTSGKEFFTSLGMNFIDSGRKVQKGKNKGKPILVPDIKSENDIPEKVKQFFDDSYIFLENLVGKENIVYAEVHYDEDTPHMHFYFLPVVDKVKRKVFETDENGKILYREGIDKNGNTKMVPIQKKDEKGKNVYNIETGKFLNCDHFWKQLGGKASFAKIQDDFNDYITKKGFNLDRGNIGGNAHHITKNEKIVMDLQEQIDDMKKELQKNQKLNNIELDTNKEFKDIETNDILNPVKRKIVGYKDEDINKLIEYSKSTGKENSKNKNIIRKKDSLINDLNLEINLLQSENAKLKDGRGIKERDTIIEEQKVKINSLSNLIKQKDKIIESLEDKIDKLQESFEKFKNKMYTLCDKFCKAISHLVGKHDIEEDEIDYDMFEYHADNIIHKYEKKEIDKDDFCL